jgi:hypothetical protein
MHKSKASEKDKYAQAGLAGILADAQVALREAKTRVRSIRGSIRAIEAKIRSGEPLPECLGRRQGSTQKI